MECDTLFYAFDAQMHYVRGYTVKGWAAFKVVRVLIRWQRKDYIVCQCKYAYVHSYVPACASMLHSCVAMECGAHGMWHRVLCL